MALPLTALDLMAHDIYACVCTALDEAATDLGPAYPGCPPCGGVVPGVIALDACAGCAESSGCGGQLNVAVRRIYPTSFDTFPRQFSGVQGTKGCPTALNVAAELVVGLSRCVPVSDEFGNPPSAASLAAAAEILHVDMTAVHNALLCCLPGLAPELPRGLKYTVGESRVIGPSGGCVGFEQIVTVELQGCACPEEGVHP